MKLAIGLEKRYSKDEILQAYLNIAGFGGNTYGVQAASLQYFSKNAADLTLAEAASAARDRAVPDAARPAEPKTTTRRTRTAATSSCTPCTPRATSRRPSATRRSRPRSTPTSCTRRRPPADASVRPRPSRSSATTRIAASASVESLGGTAEERRAAFKRGGYTRRHLDQPGAAAGRHRHRPGGCPEGRDALPARCRRHLGAGQHRAHPGR